MSKPVKNALIIGGGAFGTSIAKVLSSKFPNVYILVRSKDVYTSINSGENKVYLPGLQLASNIKAVLSWDELSDLTNNEVNILVNGLPTSAINTFYREHTNQVAAFLDKKIPLVSLSKGIDTTSFLLPDELFYNIFPQHTELFTFLSGPSFAKEILQEQITLVSLAGKSREVLLDLSTLLGNEYFKVFPTYDVKGLLLGGALKNILAIAGGVVEGLGYNHNTRAALITRGIVEMLRFGKVFNARPETFYGLSGMGDLILTTTGDLSRNKAFGLELAKGRSPQEIIESQRSVVEGYKTTLAAYELAQKHDIHTRIFHAMYQLLYLGEEPRNIIKNLMKLPAKFEDYSA